MEFQTVIRNEEMLVHECSKRDEIDSCCHARSRLLIRVSRAALLVIVLIASFPTKAAAQFLVDTGPGNTDLSTSLNLVGSNSPQCGSDPNCQGSLFLAGQFTLASPATLDSVQAWMYVSAGGSLDVKISADNGGVPGAAVFSKTYTVGAQAVGWAIFSNYSAVLAAGTYWLSFEPPDGSSFDGTMPVGAPNPLQSYAYFITSQGWLNFSAVGQQPGLGIRIANVTSQPSQSFTITFYGLTGASFSIPRNISYFTKIFTGTFQIANSALGIPNNLILYRNPAFLSFDVPITTDVRTYDFNLSNPDIKFPGDPFPANGGTQTEPLQGLLLDAGGAPKRFDTPSSSFSNSASIRDFTTSPWHGGPRPRFTLVDGDAFDFVELADGTFVHEVNLAGRTPIARFAGQWGFSAGAGLGAGVGMHDGAVYSGFYKITPAGAGGGGGNSGSSGKGWGDPSDVCGSCSCAEPINIGSGNVFEKVVDYDTAGPNKLSFTRYYNSLPGQSIPATALGVNWRSTYDRYIRISSPSAVSVERQDGQTLSFALNGTAWTTDSDVDLMLTQAGSTWTLTDSNDTVETYATVSSTLARLTAVRARNGYLQTLSYEGDQLGSVTDSYNRSLTFSYDGNGLLSEVSTPDGTSLTYGYVNNGGLNVLSSVTYPTAPATNLTYLYESSLPYALTGMTDETGNRYATWSYDASGRASSNQTGSGSSANTVTVSYDDSTESRTVTNALGQQEVYKFTTLQGVPKVTEIDRVATSTTPAAVRTFAYDANGYTAAATDWNGNQTLYTNDVHGQPTNIKEGVAGTSAGRNTTIVYDKTFIHLPKTIKTQGLNIGFVYDTQGNLLTKTLTDTSGTTAPYSTDGQTRTWTYSWSNFLLASVQGPRSDITAKTTYGYDSDGALTSITNALNQTTRITQHTGGGLPLSVVDPNDVTTTFTYDGRQRLTSSSVSTSAGPRTTAYTYSTGNNIQTVTLPDGSALTNSYDASHRLTGLADNIGNQMRWTLDANGDAVQRALLDAGSNTRFARTATFDTLGRMLQDTSAATQKSTVYIYDNDGNAVSITDPLNHQTAQVFDALNRLTQVTDANGGITKIAYDQNDRIKKINPPRGATAYVHDGFGDLIEQTSPDSGTTVYRYDADGDLTQKIDAAGNITNYTYDALDRVLTARYPAASALNVSYSYDQNGHGFGVGRLTSLTDAVGSLSRSYDERGNLLTETRVSGTKTLAMGYSYDPASRIASITYPSGAAVSYAHDAAGRILTVTATPPGAAPMPVLSDIGTLPFGPVNSFNFGNGIADTRTFDLDYRLNTLTDAGNSSLVQKLTYGYDDADNVLSIADGVNAGRNQALGYDVIDRLVSAAGAYGNLTYNYDNNSNRRSEKLGKAVTRYTYTAGTNRLESITAGGVTISVSTDANGNITRIPPANSGTAATFTYNAAEQLASVTGSPLAASFTYDAFGQRLAKANPGSNPTMFSYGQDGGLLEENSNGAITDYIYVNGAPVATLVPATGKVYFLHTDHLGTPQLATDGTQRPVWSTAYQPFGTTALINGSITQNLRLPGQYADAETGFNHNGVRDYMPTLGRYLESDSIGLRGGPNTYAYASNNPTRFVDLEGKNILVLCLAAYGIYELEQHISGFAEKSIDSYYASQEERQYFEQCTRLGNCDPNRLSQNQAASLSAGASNAQAGGELIQDLNGARSPASFQSTTPPPVPVPVVGPQS